MTAVDQALVDIVRDHTLLSQSAHFVEVIIILQKKCFKRIRKEKEKARAVYASDNRRTEQTPQKCFKCGSEDNLIAKCPNSPKDNEKRRKQVRLNEKGNCACHNGKNNSYQNIYASMACWPRG